MRVIFNAGPLPEKYRNVVAAIGVFDGVHRGHQRVISRAVAQARRLNGSSVVVTFYPHPAAVLRPREFDGYVCSLEQRLQLIEGLGADVCYVIPFSRTFSRLTSDDFMAKIIVERLRAVCVVTGEDFHFGFRQQGSVDSFRLFGLGGSTVPLLKVAGTAVKTRSIKALIRQGDLPAIKTFLNRDYGIEGKVVPGWKIGRKLGFPTANLAVEDRVMLPAGIYAVRVWVRDRRYDGVFYIGLRPSIQSKRPVLALEAHLLDFQGNLYGRTIRVDFLKKLRDDRTFPDKNSLVDAIALDVKRARRYFHSLR